MVDELSALGLRHVGYGVPVELPLGLHEPKVSKLDILIALHGSFLTFMKTLNP